MIQEFPKWFRDMETKLRTEKVGTVFCSLDRKANFLIEYLMFFGVLYRDKIKTLLNVVSKDKEEHPEQVLGIYLKCVAKSKNVASFSVIDETTIMLRQAELYEKSQDIWTSAIQEMTKYILAWSMPLQESRLRDCYTIQWIKIKIDADELEYQNLLMTLFPMKPQEVPPEISQVNELMLYKRTALKIYGKAERSWAAYLCSWLKNKDLDNPLLNRMKTSPFYKIFIGSSGNKKINASNQTRFKVTSSEQSLPSKSKSLQKDLFFDTIENLCKYFLPRSRHFKKKLLELFESTLSVNRSDSARETIMYYIYYLEENYAQDQSETFFKNGLDVLNRQVPDGVGEVYDFLHGLLHYFNCLNQSADSKAKDFLFRAIASLTLTDRKKYDKQIKEFHENAGFSRQKFKIDSSLLDFVNNHRLTFRQWGEIILRNSRSIAPGPQTAPCPFMGPELYLKLVDEIEKITRMITEDMIYDLLYFQMISLSGHIFDIVTQFSTLRDLIIAEHLNDVSIPGELCKKLEDISGYFLEQFTETLSSDICKLNERGYTLSSINQTIAAYLSFATYPKDWMPSSELIPLQVKDNQLIFPEKVLTDVINYQRQLFPSLESGPTWLVRWEFNEILKIYSMIIILTNPLNNISCSFKVPVKIPLNEEKSIQVCKLMAASLDNLGKDLLSEERESKAMELKLTIKKRTRSSSVYGTPKEKFDQHLEFSPLIKHEFETIAQKEEESWLNEIKSDLYEVIKSLHTNFLQSYFFVSDPMNVTESFSSSDIQIIFSRTGGLYLTSMLTYCDIERRKLISDEKLHIRNDDYSDRFLKIYQTIWDEDKPHRSYEDDFTLYFYAYDVKKISVNLQIDNLYLDVIEKEPKIVQITMTLKDDKETYSLPIKRPLFKCEKEFQDFMLWQIAVVCNDSKEDWLWKY